MFCIIWGGWRNWAASVYYKFLWILRTHQCRQTDIERVGQLSSCIAKGKGSRAFSYRAKGKAALSLERRQRRGTRLYLFQMMFTTSFMYCVYREKNRGSDDLKYGDLLKLSLLDAAVLWWRFRYDIKGGLGTLLYFKPSVLIIYTNIWRDLAICLMLRECVHWEENRRMPSHAIWKKRGLPLKTLSQNAIPWFASNEGIIV